MSGKYALIIGNTEYIDAGLAQLAAPGKDTEDFARVLKEQDVCAFDDVKVSLNQLSSSVIEAIDEFFDCRSPIEDRRCASCSSRLPLRSYVRRRCRWI